MIEIPGDRNVQGRPRLDRLGVKATGGGGEQADLAFQNTLAGGPSQRRQIRRDHTAFGRMARLEGFGPSVRQEILAHARSLRARDAQAYANALGVQPPNLGSGDCGAEDAEHAGGVKAGFISARIAGLGQLGLDLDPQMIGQQEIAARLGQRVAHRQCGGQGGDAGVGEKAVNPVLGHRQLGIVIIVSMDSDAVGEGGETRNGFDACAQHARGTRRRTEFAQVAPHDGRALGFFARQGEAKSIQDVLFGKLDQIGRQRLPLRARDKGRDLGGEAVGLRHGGAGRPCQGQGRGRKAGEKLFAVEHRPSPKMPR